MSFWYHARLSSSWLANSVHRHDLIKLHLLGSRDKASAPDTKKTRFLVGLCGIPASGKTTFAHKVVEYVNTRYCASHPVSVDEVKHIGNLIIDAPVSRVTISI